MNNKEAISLMSVNTFPDEVGIGKEHVGNTLRNETFKKSTS